MYFLFADASADPGWPKPYGASPSKYYVLAGLCIPETKVRDMESLLDSVKQKHILAKGLKLKEFKYSALIAAKSEPWKNLTDVERKQVADDIFDALLKLDPVIFAIVIDKLAHRAKYNYPHRPDTLSMRFLMPRYQKFLDRKSEKGVIIIDPSTKNSDDEIKQMLSDSKKSGVVLQSFLSPDPFRTNTKLPSVTSTFFSPSEDSAGIQFVDFIAYSIWSHFERRKSTRFGQIKPFFDNDKGITYGLKKWP